MKDDYKEGDAKLNDMRNHKVHFVGASIQMEQTSLCLIWLLLKIKQRVSFIFRSLL